MTPRMQCYSDDAACPRCGSLLMVLGHNYITADGVERYQRDPVVISMPEKRSDGRKVRRVPSDRVLDVESRGKGGAIDVVDHKLESTYPYICERCNMLIRAEDAVRFTGTANAGIGA